MIIINSQEEMEKYYIEESVTYFFDDDVKFNCNVNVTADINASDINALDINAGDIKADDINADDINYYAECLASETFKCHSVAGRRENAKHFCLDGEIEYVKEDK